MTRGNPDVSILVPTLNEVENVDLLVEQLTQAFASEPYAFEILVADGGSTDGTCERVEVWSERHPVRLIRCSSGRGLAGDVVEGARAARGDVVVVLDADLSHPPRTAPALARLVLEDEADVAIGSRYCPGGSTPGWPLVRRIYSRAASLLVRPLLDVHDPLSGFFAVRRARLIESGERAEGFKIGLEVLLGGQGALRVAEVPIEFRDRTLGRSKLNRREALTYFRRLLEAYAGGQFGSAPIRFLRTALVGLTLDFLVGLGLLGLGASVLQANAGGFAVATVLWSAVHALARRRELPGRALDWSFAARFLLLAIMAFSLRGAALGVALRAGAAPEAALILAALTAAIAYWTGSLFFVREPSNAGPERNFRWRALAVGLGAYLLLLRLAYLGLPNLLVEEAYYWNYAKHPALSYLDHPPMVASLIRLGTFLFGDSELGIRAPAFLCTLIWMVFGFGLARNLFDRSTALLTALLLNALPLFFVLGFFMTPDSPLLASWAGTLYFLERALLGQKPRAWYGAGVCLGLGLLSKYTIILLAPAALLFILLHAPSRSWLRRKEPYLAFALALAIFSPVLIWNAQNDWASFVFQGPRRMSSGRGLGLPRLLASILVVLSPTVAVAAFHSLLNRDRELGAGTELARRRAVRTFSLVFTFVPVSVFAWFSLTHTDIKLNWTGPAWLALLPLLAAQWVALPGAAWSKWRKMVVGSLGGTVAVLATIYGLGLQYYALGFPGVGFPSSSILFGWADLGAQVERIEDALEKESGIEPLVMGLDKYNITSELAFYRLRANRHSDDAHERIEGVSGTVGRHLVGKTDLMYRFWADEDLCRGRTVVLVAEDTEFLASADLAAHFDSMSSIETLHTTHNGKPSRSYQLRIGYGFQPGLTPQAAP